jgi:hypothetical protein
MSKISVSIDMRAFGSQGEAIAFFKAMLNRYKPGERVSDEDALDLAALLVRHDEYADKVGIGVNYFEVMMTEHGTQCFRVVRTDGTGTDFSYGHCVRGRPPSHKSEVLRALRQAIRFDLYKARDDFFANNRNADGFIACAVSKERIAPEHGHMDHRPPITFEVIVMTFLEARGLAYDTVPITHGLDNQVTPTLTDAGLANDFRSFHARVARLDFVSDTINLAQSSRARIRPTRIRIDQS